MTRLLKIFPLRTWLILIGVALFCLLVLSWCDARKDVATMRGQGTIADARTGTASQAIDAIGDNAAADSRTLNDVKDAQDAIRSAPPADRDRVARERLRDLQGRSPD